MIHQLPDGITTLAQWEQYDADRQRRVVKLSDTVRAARQVRMADGLYYQDTREPFITADIASVTLAATHKALYPASNFPLLGGQYFARPGKKLHIVLFGRITTGATPGNITVAVLYGTGADNNGTSIVTSAAVALIASQTNISWMLDVMLHCRSTGSAGTIFGCGFFQTGAAVIATTAQPVFLPASAAAVSGALDLTSSTLFPSCQALRSGSTAETMQVHDMKVVAVN